MLCRLTSRSTAFARLVTGLRGARPRNARSHLVHGDADHDGGNAFRLYFPQDLVGHVEAVDCAAGIFLSTRPEEVNRKVAGAVADLHFAPTETAAAALRAENVPADRIHVTGNTVIDALLATKARIDDELRWPPASIRSLSAAGR